MEKLTKKKCVPCESDAKPFTLEQTKKYLAEVPGWHLTPAGKQISRKFTFKNFKEALMFVNWVGELAEREGHHPNIQIYAYKNIRLTLSTHAIGGLSENDFILAAKINEGRV